MAKDYIKIEISGRLTDLNEYIRVERGNRYAAASLKKKDTELVASQATEAGIIKEPCLITFNWLYSTRHDFDNIAFAKKFVLDGLVKAGVLSNDNQDSVAGFGGEYFTRVKKGEEGVIVELESM